jgi:diaminohydroxyphosphoribosylaminopyrimidine deaminase/5-amino-6-(5-phosphoribosylamino)uracil reductase
MAAGDDSRYMAAALRLARWNTGRTATNPSVGCLVVKDGVIVGRGVTAPGGRPHAEPQALAEAGEAARGATAYVTLEPCSHHGKTPPCANALIASGVARVVVSVTDPDSRVSGRGLALLREAGIAVETGVLEEEGRRVLAAYLTRQVEKRAHVTLKLAVSADGMIGRLGEGQVAITGPVARAQVHAMRAETDAILVGIGTARADDPLLDVRLNGLEQHSPYRFVIDPRLDLSLTSRIAQTAGRVPVTVVQVGPEYAVPPSVLPDISPSRGEITEWPASRSPVSPSTLSAAEKAGGGGRGSISPLEGEMPGRAEGGTARQNALQSANISIWQTPSLHALLARMAEEGISSLMVEGGAKTVRDFLAAGLVDRIVLFEGPAEIGAGGVASPVTRTHMPAGFRLVASETFGPDRAYHYERED